LGGQLNALNKKNVVHQSLAIINKVKDPIEQLEYAKLLSSKVGVPESIIVSELQHQESNSIAGGEELAEQKTVFSPYFELEKQLIGLLLTYFDNLPELPKMILENEALNEIYQVICEARVQKSDIEVALKKTPDAWQKRMDALVIETIQRHEGEDEEATRLDIVDTITRLQDRDRDNRVASNAQAIAAAFAAGDKEKARKLLKKLDSDTIDKV